MNVVHERNHVLRERLRGEALLSKPMAAELEQPWRTNGVVVQVLFFVLTSVALGSFYGLCELFKVPSPGVVVGVIAIALAEYLMRARRWFWTGVEAALWIAGLIALITELPNSGRPEAVLVFAAAFAIAGARVRNPLFGAIAAALVAFYCETRFDLGVVVALAIALVAMLALLWTWKRPSTEWLFIAVALVLPVVGRLYGDENWQWLTITLYFVFAAIALALAIAKPHHLFFLTAMLAGAISSVDLARLVKYLPVEARFAIAGALLLGIAYAISQLLRDRTTGFVLTPAKLTPFDDELQLAATFAIKPESSEPVPSDGLKPGGGSFGGAGASGDY
ncbi:MAG TPA: hypothetical protein VE010_05175 [Thermoanaerobaculia bacterium]|nr:hypothetical protein [Thermoanaerobaculia bacterium]